MIATEGRYIQNPEKIKKLPVLKGAVNGQTRDFSTVCIEGMYYWADRVTGSLYRMNDGRCLSSSYLRLTRIPTYNH